MNYTDSEIVALAQFAMSPCPVNWELFSSQPLEERLRAFDWWWDRWEGAEFDCKKNKMFNSDYDPSLVWTKCIYKFVGIKINLTFGILTCFSAKIFLNGNALYDSVDNYFSINNTDNLPLDQIKNEIYNAIKNHIKND